MTRFVTLASSVLGMSSLLITAAYGQEAGGISGSLPGSVMVDDMPSAAVDASGLPSGLGFDEMTDGPQVSGEAMVDPATGASVDAENAYLDLEMQDLEATARASDIIEVSRTPSANWMLDESFLEEAPCLKSSGGWFNAGGWYASGESVWLDRSRAYRRTMAVDTAVLPPPPYDPSRIDDYPLRYTTVARPFNVAPGARATLGRYLGRDHLNRDRSVEFTYYGGMTYEQTDGWNALGNATTPYTLVTPLALRVPGYNGAGFYTTAFNSDFNSYEWNFKLRRRLGRDKMVMMPNGDWARHAERAFLPAGFIGIRLANVNEDFFWQSGREGVDFSQFGGNYEVHTENWLLGMNFGGELISQNEFFYWGIRGRAAPCLSFASETQSNVSNNFVDTDFA
jgi:hypothetical protein